jgi:hypothetical protein
VPCTGTDASAPTTQSPGTDGSDGHRPTAPTGTGTDGTDGTGTDLALSVPAPERVSFTARRLRWARGRIADAADYQRRHRTFWHAVAVFITRPPETWTQTEEHLKSGKWLQEWMTGRFRTFCEWENVAWGYLVSMPAKAVLQNIEKVFFERQLGFWLAVLFAVLCVLIWLTAS